MNAVLIVPPVVVPHYQCDQIKIAKCLKKLPKNEFTRKMNDFDTFTKIASDVGNLGKLIVAKDFKKLPKLQKIAKSGHTAHYLHRTTPHCTRYST